MSMQKLGIAYIKADGELLESMPDAKINIGGVTREPVNGGNAVLGYSEKVVHAEVECEIAVSPSTSLVTIAGWKDITVTFECDTGQVYIVRNAWLVEPPAATASEGGKVPLKFAGPPADEMK